MKPLKWREPWALSRRRFARDVLKILVRSRLPWVYLVTACVGLEVTRQLCLSISPAYPFPLARTALGLLALPIMLCLQCGLLVICPSFVEFKKKYIHASHGQSSLGIRPEHLVRWRYQERAGYRRLVVRYMDQWKKERRRVLWLSGSVDRTELEQRMDDYLARGEAERVRRAKA